MPNDELNPNTGLCSGMLKKTTITVLTIGAGHLETICEGWGTKYCAHCPHAGLIPEGCPLLEAEGAEIMCPRCTLVCPCNRSIDYQSIRREVLKYEQNRLVGKLVKT